MTQTFDHRTVQHVKAFFVVLLICFSTALPVYAAQCDVVATPLSFGTYDPFNPVPLSATSSLNISCKPPKKTFSITVQLTGGSGSISQRVMASTGGTQMLYNIYADPSHTTIFGDGTSGSITPFRTVTKATPWNLTLYGYVPALQNLTPGVYSDTITATIFF